MLLLERLKTAKAHLVACMQQGQTWQQASAKAEVQISQSNAYRLWRAFRQHGETALKDGRHGHPAKLRGEMRAFLEDTCRKTPSTPSSVIQRLLQERFDLRVSVSQINRVQATLGVSHHANNQRKKQEDWKVRLLNQHGRTGLAVFCYSLLPIKQISSPNFNQPSHQATSPLIRRCVLLTINPRHCAVSC
jgi:transposase